jgi:hypothetical protein
MLASTAAAAAAIIPSTLASAAEEPLAGKIRKAMIIGPVTEKTLAPLKEAGFAGVESRTYNITEEEGARAKSHAENAGMRIHSVMRGWAEFNSDDPAKLAATVEETRQSMRAAKWYGADDILLVPCRVEKIPMPEPWEFDIEFDEKTGHVSRVVSGDNAKFEAYIAAQNKATDTSRAAVEKLIPLAEELKIIIALENVWNNLWVQPAIYKHFVVQPSLREVVLRHRQSRQIQQDAGAGLDQDARPADRPAAHQGLQAGSRRPFRRLLPSARRQHRLARGPQSAERRQVRRLGQHRRWRPAARRVFQAV